MLNTCPLQGLLQHLLVLRSYLSFYWSQYTKTYVPVPSLVLTLKQGIPLFICQWVFPYISCHSVNKLTIDILTHRIQILAQSFLYFSNNIIRSQRHWPQFTRTTFNIWDCPTKHLVPWNVFPLSTHAVWHQQAVGIWKLSHVTEVHRPYHKFVLP